MNNKKLKTKNQSPITNHEKRLGFGLLEVIISVAIFVMIVTGVFGALMYGQENTSFAGTRTRAIFLAEEGLEAIQSMRHNGFTSLTEGTHGIAITGNHWSLSGTSDITDIFTRAIEITNIDSKRKQITSRVSWSPDTGRAGEITLATYITNWPLAHWANPVVNGGAGGNFFGDADGVKIQFQNGQAFAVTNGKKDNFYLIDVNNTESSAITSSLELKGTLQNLVIDGNYAYIAAEDNSRMFQIVDISDPANPEVVATEKPTGTKKPNGIYKFGDYVYITREEGGASELLAYHVSDPTNPTEAGTLEFSDDLQEIIVLADYAYIATSIDDKEVVVVDATTPSGLIEVGSYDLPGNNNATSIVGFSNVIILGRDNGEVFLFDVTDPTVPVKHSNNLNVNNAINDMALGNQNQYALIVTAEESDQSYFVIADISDPANPNPTATMIFSINLNGVTYDPATDRIYIVAEYDEDSGQDSFIVIEPN